MMTGSCAICGATFEFFPSQHKQTCSRNCGAIHQARKRKALGLGRQRKQPPIPDVVLVCKQCGKEFGAPRWMVEDGRIYCSRACRGLAERVPRIATECAYCGKEIVRTAAQRLGYERGGYRGKFCSRQCQSLGGTRTWTLLERTYNGRPVKQDRKGYIWVWHPERARQVHPSWGSWYPEHRLVVEEHLGRPLRSDEQVHHRGRKDDNSLGNLVVLTRNEHASVSLLELSPFIRRELAELAEYRRRYGPLTDWPSSGSEGVA